MSRTNLQQLEKLLTDYWQGMSLFWRTLPHNQSVFFVWAREDQGVSSLGMGQ